MKVLFIYRNLNLGYSIGSCRTNGRKNINNVNIGGEDLRERMFGYMFVKREYNKAKEM